LKAFSRAWESADLACVAQKEYADYKKTTPIYDSFGDWVWEVLGNDRLDESVGHQILHGKSWIELCQKFSW